VHFHRRNLCMCCAFSGGSDGSRATPQSLLNISSHSATPQTGSKTPPRSGRRSMPESGSKSAQQSGGGDAKMARLVDISGDDDDVAVEKFGRLKVGFTPGMDGKSRRVCIPQQYCCYNDC